MTTAIDTNLIVALWDRDPGLSSAAQSAFDVAPERGTLVTTAAVFAELLAASGCSESFLDSFFRESGISIDRARTLDPGPDEAHFVVEPNAPLELELPDLRFDLLADAIALLLEQPDLAFDLALDDVLSELQEAKLPLEFPFKLLQGRQLHDIHATTSCRF